MVMGQMLGSVSRKGHFFPNRVSHFGTERGCYFKRPISFFLVFAARKQKREKSDFELFFNGHYLNIFIASSKTNTKSILISLEVLMYCPDNLKNSPRFICFSHSIRLPLFQSPRRGCSEAPSDSILSSEMRVGRAHLFPRSWLHGTCSTPDNAHY